MSEPNPYAPPSDEAPPPKKKKKKRKRGVYSARFEGYALAISRDAQLPPICMMCGAVDPITRRTANFQWTPWWSRVLIPFCALAGIIAMAVTRKHAQLHVPLCIACDKRWGAARIASVLGVVALVLALVTIRILESRTALLPGVGLLLVAFVAFSFAYGRRGMLRVQRIDDVEIVVKGTEPSAARKIVEGSR